MDHNRLSYIVRTVLLGLAAGCLVTYSAMKFKASADIDDNGDPATGPVVAAQLDSNAVGVALFQNPPQQPAEQVYKNIQIFKGVPASHLPEAMKYIAASLGVQCSHCHVEGAFEKDDLPTKVSARRMFKMEQVIHKEINSNKVTCYTCHKGKQRPGPQSFSPEGWEPPKDNKWADQGKKTAGEVFKNVQVMKDELASNWMTVMSFMSASLGVDCSHCHVPGAFEKDDKPAKQMARKMLNMVTTVGKQYYEKGNRISCYTCHRGKAQPDNTPK